jgi:hypothetical protein
MAMISLEVPDNLADQLAASRGCLPELLALSLRQPALPAAVYRQTLDFLASDPSPEQLATFRPIPEAQERQRLLLTRCHEGQLTELESRELDAFAHVEHLMILRPRRRRGPARSPPRSPACRAR